MKLYMKQNVFSIKDRFTIKDQYENDKYYVEGEFLSFGKKLHILNTNGEEIAFVKQRLMTLLPKFEVYINEEMVVEVAKELTFLKPVYTLRGTSWKVQGDFWQHDYQIVDGANQIVSISKVWFSWGDSFEIDVISEADEVLAIATVLAIDCVMDTDES